MSRTVLALKWCSHTEAASTSLPYPLLQNFQCPKLWNAKLTQTTHSLWYLLGFWWSLLMMLLMKWTCLKWLSKENKGETHSYLVDSRCMAACPVLSSLDVWECMCEHRGIWENRPCLFTRLRVPSDSTSALWLKPAMRIWCERLIILMVGLPF